MHEDKYLELFLMKCGFNGVQHKQHKTDFHFLTWKVFGFFFFFSAYILVRRQLLLPKGKNPSN